MTIDDAIKFTETEMWRLLRKLVGVKPTTDEHRHEVPGPDPAAAYDNIYQQFADLTRAESLAQRAKKLRECRNILTKLDLEIKGEVS